ncbi:siderophore ABC transporter substrate-binding protein [Pelagibacterium sediminicola]|uniref:siderophore ABC transporter substrate-binding protein n=1 Tax=Pelagibacterium sediminicola TaxID=2248761 RepID=UPI001FE8836D|nr:ABC transporter substrate-binding protein [Pelagibacterium sediminicola]
MNITNSFHLPALLSAAAVSLALTAGAMAQDVTITHPQGETTINGVPEKVFVIDWAAFDNLTALGVEVAGAPGSNAPGYLAGSIPSGLVNVGSLFEPDFEAIAAEQPDLVIVAGRSAATYPTVSEIAPTIDMSVSNVEGIVDGVKGNLETLGEIFSVEAKADKLIAALDAKVAEARDLAADEGTGLVIVTNAGNLGIYGPDSRVAWVYNELGIPSVFDEVDDRDHGGDAISFEYLLENNPDWLFVVDRDAGVGNEGAARQLLDNELIHQTTFWQNDQIIYLDPQAAYITMHGYSGLMLMLDQIIEGFGSAQ